MSETKTYGYLFLKYYIVLSAVWLARPAPALPCIAFLGVPQIKNASSIAILQAPPNKVETVQHFGKAPPPAEVQTVQ